MMDLVQEANPCPEVLHPVQHKPDERDSLLWNLWRIAGRFYWARRALGKFFGLKTRFRARPAQSVNFPDLDVERTVNALHQDAVAFGLNLSATSVAAIREFAHRTELIQENYADRIFSYADCREGAFADGAPIPLAYAKNRRPGQ